MAVGELSVSIQKEETGGRSQQSLVSLWAVVARVLYVHLSWGLSLTLDTEDLRATQKVTAAGAEDTVPHTPAARAIPPQAAGLCGNRVSAWPHHNSEKWGCLLPGSGQVESWRGLPPPSESTHTSTLGSVSMTQRKLEAHGGTVCPEGCLQRPRAPPGMGAEGAVLWGVGTAKKGVLPGSSLGLTLLGTSSKLCPAHLTSALKTPRRAKTPIPGTAPWGVALLAVGKNSPAASRSCWKSAPATQPPPTPLTLPHRSPAQSSKGQLSRCPHLPASCWWPHRQPRLVVCGSSK